MSESVGTCQIFKLLIGFQTANEITRVAARVMMYVFTDRNQCSYSTSAHCFLHHRVGVKSESRSESRSNKDDLGKVSREKNIFFSYVVLASRAKVGQRAEETKNDLREGFKIFSPGIALQLV